MAWMADIELVDWGVFLGQNKLNDYGLLLSLCRYQSLTFNVNKTINS